MLNRVKKMFTKNKNISVDRSGFILVHIYNIAFDIIKVNIMLWEIIKNKKRNLWFSNYYSSKLQPMWVFAHKLSIA